MHFSESKYHIATSDKQKDVNLQGEDTYAAYNSSSLDSGSM